MQYVAIALFVCVFTSAFFVPKHTRHFDKHNITLFVMLVLSLAFIISFYEMINMPFMERVAYSWFIPIYAFISMLVFFISDIDNKDSISRFCATVAGFMTFTTGLTTQLTHERQFAELLVSDEMLCMYISILLGIWIFFLIRLIADQ